MGYLKEFQSQIASRDFTKFMQLWEEYGTCDAADPEELTVVLQTIKNSDFVKQFGQYVESILPLWSTITDFEQSYQILKLILDLQTTQSEKLAELTLQALAKKYGQEALTQERLKLIGLRTKDNFPSAIANFDLLAHIKKGNFVFHPGGWGAGEIMDFSQVREQFAVEFENVSGIKQITFSNAFKTLIPLPSDHFLAQRFSNPDQFEKVAKEDPIKVIKLLLKDLGPKNAAEIKDELCELVIPEKEWAKWWQATRAKIKKDTEIESPEALKEPFRLRKQALSHESQLLATLEKEKNPKEILLLAYNFVRDYAVKVKQPEIKTALGSALKEILNKESLPLPLKLQVYFCLDSIQEQKNHAEIESMIKKSDNLEDIVNAIDIVAYKKVALQMIKKFREDWGRIFIKFFSVTPLGLLRDYLFKELMQGEEKTKLNKTLSELLESPWTNPDLFLWYFFKLIEDGDSDLPYHNKEGRDQFAEGYLVLLSRIENLPEHKDTVKKMHNALLHQRYALVRKIFSGSTLTFVKEFLLLATKCHTISDHDLKIFRSLAEVVHPSLADKEKSSPVDNTIWTTEAGFFKTQERIKQIGTKEVVENAKEIEAARALGDLRENSEYKYAQEKRARLQGELKHLSDQLKKARIITPEDITKDEISVGSVIEVTDTAGKKQEYSILGPWEANPEGNILSYQSKLAQALLGLGVGDKFNFKEEEYTINSIRSIFDK